MAGTGVRPKGVRRRGVDEILAEILRVKGFGHLIPDKVERRKVLAELFGVEVVTVKAWEHRQHIPLEQLTAHCEREGYSMDWMLWHVGQLYRQDVVEKAAAGIDEADPRARTLLKIIARTPALAEKLLQATQDPDLGLALDDLCRLGPEQLHALRVVLAVGKPGG